MKNLCTHMDIRGGGGLIGRRALNRIVTVITVLEAILTGKQSHENIQCFVYFFPSCRLKFPRKKKIADKCLENLK